MQAEALLEPTEFSRGSQHARSPNGLQVDEGRAVWVSVQLVCGARRSRCGPASAPEGGLRLPPRSRGGRTGSFKELVSRVMGRGFPLPALFPLVAVNS